jgi:hypothetical protein
LHNVVDAVADKSASIQDHVSRDEEDAIAEFFLSKSRDAICFDAGDAGDLLRINGIPGLVRLPYDVCWIEMVANGVVVGSLCVPLDGAIVVSPAIKKPDGWMLGASMLISQSDGLIQYIVPPQTKDWHEAIGATISRFLSAMNCTNVSRIESKPSEALNKARVRRGKRPLFSTWTLSISIPKERRDSVALGGAHASPRVHLRRGHPREYKPGLWTWVQPCAVGAKENGMIHKDYKAVVTKP